MMQTQPLPTCEEYDPLEAHMDELEGPGSNFLQDFIMPQQQAGGADTPVSNSNGYTSEESDYSVATPSDEQNYQNMSFLQAGNTNELADGVASGVPTSSLSTPAQHPQKFVGKVIKGKTSKYRGVTQTSKTSWGAKYSAKRITNTCKTPEEAAHAYDEYLKTNYPQKYAKFANFCGKCGKFVNPLGLPQFQSECLCSGNAITPCAGTSTPTSSSTVSPPSIPNVSPKKEIFSRQQITTPTATSSLAPPTAPSPAAGPSTAPPNAALAMLGSSTHSLDCPNPAEDDDMAMLSRNSNLSVGSLKFSFSDDTEQFFAESFNDVAKLSGSAAAPGASTGGLQGQQQQFSGDGNDAVGPQDQKRDSLPMAVISSAVDSFTQEDNLDQIIKDINRSSSSHSLGKVDMNGLAMDQRLGGESVGSYSATGSSSGSGNPLGNMQIEPTSVNSSFVDFSADELQDLSEYFLSEHDAAAVVQRELQPSNPPVSGQDPNVVAAQNNLSSLFKKNHSLDFDSEDGAMTGSSRGLDSVKLEDGDMQSINSFMQPAQPGMGNAAATGLIVPAGSPPPAMIEIQTPFLEKYWRNDRKNIQCFPYCPEHGDYYRVRIENLQHRCKGVCRAAVKAHIMIPTSAGPAALQAGMMVLARCNSTFSRNEALTAQRSLNLSEMQSLQSVSAVGVIDNFVPLSNGMPGVQFDVTFHPDVWKFEFDLPKKRRHMQSGSPATSSHAAHDAIDAPGDHLGSEFLYFFEIDVFYSRDEVTFERLGHTKSTNFQIGNTRTLLRQRNKMVEDLNNSGGPKVRSCMLLGQPTEMAEDLSNSGGPLAQSGHSDSDKVAEIDDMPKKRVKIFRGQHQKPSFNEDGSIISSSRGGSGHSKISVGYITGEGTSSSSKKNLLDPEAPMDLDGYFRTDSKDSIFDAEPGSSDLPKVEADVWKDVDSDDQQQAATADYRPYVSPKPKSERPMDVQTANPPAAVVTTKTPAYSHPEAQPVGISPSAGAHSLPKLLGYSLVCVPLSIAFLPVGLLLLLAFVLLPPAASGIVRALDALSDMELSRANSSRAASDSRMVLARLEEESVDGKPQGSMFRYHGKGAVWGRLAYFIFAKLVISIVALVPTLVLGLLAGLTYPIRPASSALAGAACQCALWSREYTRNTTGKPLSPGAAHYEEQGGLV